MDASPPGKRCESRVPLMFGMPGHRLEERLVKQEPHGLRMGFANGKIRLTNPDRVSGENALN